MTNLTDQQVLEMVEVYAVNQEDDDSPIYRWVHAQLAKYPGGCDCSHDDWREEAEQTHQKLKDEGELR